MREVTILKTRIIEGRQWVEISCPYGRATIVWMGAAPAVGQTLDVEFSFENELVTRVSDTFVDSISGDPKSLGAMCGVVDTVFEDGVVAVKVGGCLLVIEVPLKNVKPGDRILVRGKLSIFPSSA